MLTIWTTFLRRYRTRVCAFIFGYQAQDHHVFTKVLVRASLDSKSAPKHWVRAVSWLVNKRWVSNLPRVGGKRFSTNLWLGLQVFQWLFTAVGILAFLWKLVPLSTWGALINQPQSPFPFFSKSCGYSFILHWNTSTLSIMVFYYPIRDIFILYNISLYIHVTQNL